MTPYYSDERVTLYHGDCREILPSLSVDALVTDQPYGTGWARGGGSVGVFHARHERPLWDVFSLDWLHITPVKFWATFCPHSQITALTNLATSRVNWRKTNPRPMATAIEPIFLWPLFLPEGIEWVGYNGDTPDHPCQKPEALLLWLLRFCDPQYRICDPFMGSGTTVVAAKRLGRHAIGIELDERYCEIAATRLSQGVLTLEMTA